MALFQSFHLLLLFEVLQSCKNLLFSCMVTADICWHWNTNSCISILDTTFHCVEIQQSYVAPVPFPMDDQVQTVVCLDIITVTSFSTWSMRTNQHRAGFICNEALVDFTAWKYLLAQRVFQEQRTCILNQSGSSKFCEEGGLYLSFLCRFLFKQSIWIWNCVWQLAVMNLLITWCFVFQMYWLYLMIFASRLGIFFV